METDYLVVGSGASGLAFVDALVAGSDAEVVMVDRRHAPGGHWLDAYPYVRLHQPSAVYGVTSRRLGGDRIDESGPNAGFYERASGPAVCDYFGRVMDEQLIAGGKVRFWGLHDYRGEDAEGHHVVSLATGRETAIRVRRRVVDATYVESEIPSRRPPAYAVEDGARVVPPNALAELSEAPAGYTVIGAGKTAMDTVCWLLDCGVDPDRVRWIRSRDAWVFDRAVLQPLDLVATYMGMMARWVESAAVAQDGQDFARRLEAQGVLLRVDPAVEPLVWRGATVSRGELAAMRSIERVERRRVRAVGSHRIACDGGDLPTSPDELHVDCTAPGLPARAPRPVFEPGRITIQHVIVGSATWGAATLGRVESLELEDDEKNTLCPPITYSGNAADLLRLAHQGLLGTFARAANREVAVWTDRCRLNPTSAAREHRADPAVAEAAATIRANFGPALANPAAAT